jgi:1-acyl-sn-glycerol-3-phosphate acyltransferase
MGISSGLSRLALRLIGWTVLDLPQRPERAVVVVYPHTSNWDFPIGVLAKTALRLNIRWVGKDALFRGAMGPLMHWLGGIPVNRKQPAGFADHIAKELGEQEPFLLAITPEGTRSRTPGWKSGFYRIARAAKVPVVIATIDYAHKRIGLLATMELTGDEDADMVRIADLYQGCKGRRPELASPILLL